MVDAGALPDVESFREFAARLGCRPGYVTALRKSGRLVLTDDRKRVKVAESLKLIVDSRDPAKAPVAARHAAQRATAANGAGEGATPPPAAADGEGSGMEPITSGYQHWRERSEKAKALGLERENEIAEGKLLDAGQVANAAANAATTLRTRLEHLPDILGPQLAAQQDEGACRAMLAEAIEHELDELARQFGSLGRAAA